MDRKTSVSWTCSADQQGGFALGLSNKCLPCAPSSLNGFIAFPIPKIQSVTLVQVARQTERRACDSRNQSEPFPHSRIPSLSARQTMPHDLYVALPCALEEKPDDKYLESTHADDEPGLDQAEVDNPLLSAPDGAEVAVLTCAEVLLVS